jgi:hypothetical protein
MYMAHRDFSDADSESGQKSYKGTVKHGTIHLESEYGTMFNNDGPLVNDTSSRISGTQASRIKLACGPIQELVDEWEIRCEILSVFTVQFRREPWAELQDSRSESKERLWAGLGN